MAKLKAIFFDVGETLIDETRLMQIWADTLGVGRDEFMAALDDVIFNNEPIRRVFERLRPGFDVAAARAQRRRDGSDFFIEARDLYADAKPCLSALKQQGLFVGIAGNQPPTAKATLESFGLDARSDHDVGRARRGQAVSRDFFQKILELGGLTAGRDRVCRRSRRQRRDPGEGRRHDRGVPRARAVRPGARAARRCRRRGHLSSNR